MSELRKSKRKMQERLKEGYRLTQKLESQIFLGSLPNILRFPLNYSGLVKICNLYRINCILVFYFSFDRYQRQLFQECNIPEREVVMHHPENNTISSSHVTTRLINKSFMYLTKIRIYYTNDAENILNTVVLDSKAFFF